MTLETNEITEKPMSQTGRREELFVENHDKTNIPINPEEHLLELWIDDLEIKSVLPVHNKSGLLTTLLDAKRSGKPVTLLAIACLDWQAAPQGQDPMIDRIISPVFFNNPRAVRVAEGFSQLQQALHSFGIESQTCFSFSDVEAIMTAKLENMGQTLFNFDLEGDIAISINSILHHARERGVNITMFKHLESLVVASGETDLRKIQNLLSGRDDPNYHQLLSGLYKFDLTILPQLIGQGNPLIWLNLISTSFLDHIQEITDLAKQVNPSMAVVSPFKNAGSWATTPVSQPSILNKRQFISNILGVDNSLEDESWLRALLGVDDRRIVSLLKNLGINVSIHSATDKRDAANIVGQISVGKKLEAERIMTLTENIGIIDFLRNNLGISGVKVRDLIKSGGVRVDGMAMKDIGFILDCSSSRIIEIGRKTKMIIN